MNPVYDLAHNQVSPPRPTASAINREAALVPPPDPKPQSWSQALPRLGDSPWELSPSDDDAETLCCTCTPPVASAPCPFPFISTRPLLLSTEAAPRRQRQQRGLPRRRRDGCARGAGRGSRPRRYASAAPRPAPLRGHTSFVRGISRHAVRARAAPRCRARAKGRPTPPPFCCLGRAQALTPPTPPPRAGASARGELYACARGVSALVIPAEGKVRRSLGLARAALLCPGGALLGSRLLGFGAFAEARGTQQICHDVNSDELSPAVKHQTAGGVRWPAPRLQAPPSATAARNQPTAPPRPRWMAAARRLKRRRGARGAG